MAAIDKTEYQTHVSLAGGRIRCLRCTAQSSRTMKQCGKPAMNSSATQKCTHHGGRSTGPRTAAGKQRLLKAHLLHGEHTKTARAEYSKDSAKLSMLEDCLRVLGMDIKRRQGSKAAGYRAVRTIGAVTEFVRGLR
jgi:hypothetical protein